MPFSKICLIPSSIILVDHQQKMFYPDVLLTVGEMHSNTIQCGQGHYNVLKFK